jgi:hypothetical protein
VAVGHDLRLRTLYEELGIGHSFVAAEAGGDLASHPDDLDEMLAVASARMDEVLSVPGDVSEILLGGYLRHLRDARRNRELLLGFANAHGWGSVPWAA